MGLFAEHVYLLPFTALHPHAHSASLRDSSPAPHGAKTAYVGGVPASQDRYGFTDRNIFLQKITCLNWIMEGNYAILIYVIVQTVCYS